MWPFKRAPLEPGLEHLDRQTQKYLCAPGILATCGGKFFYRRWPAAQELSDVDWERMPNKSKNCEIEVPRACLASGDSISGQPIVEITAGVKKAGTLGFIDLERSVTWRWHGQPVSAKYAELILKVLGGFAYKFGLEKRVQERIVGVSNQHVLGRVNNAVLSPGTLDGGDIQKHLCGRVVRSADLDAGELDVASFELQGQGNFDLAELERAREEGGFGPDPVIGQVLSFKGRTSGEIGECKVIGLDGTSVVAYPDGSSRWMRGLVFIDAPSYIPGDSGAAFRDVAGKVVALGFASAKYIGRPGYLALAFPISAVKRALSIP
jgi:hypothetical protein